MNEFLGTNETLVMVKHIRRINSVLEEQSGVRGYMQVLRSHGEAIACYWMLTGDLPPEYIPDYNRADGGTLCPTCQRDYLYHPHAYEVLGWSSGKERPFLNRLCDGGLVKL